MAGSGDKKQLGKILLKQRLVTPDELDELLTRQKSQPGQRLASTAHLSGKVSEVELLKALSEQHGVPGIDLAQVVVPLENLRLIPADIAKQHLILPVLVKEDRIFMGMADPTDRRVIDEIEFVTGRRVFPYVALHESLAKVIDEAYRKLGGSEEYYIGPKVSDEYLESLGLPPRGQSGARMSERARADEPNAVVVDRAMPAASLDDELGVAELRSAQNGSDGAAPAPAANVGPVERTTARRRARPENPKILVVDDEDDIRRLLARVLTQKGYSVIEASKGIEALELVRDHVPDVILLDAMLPEVHGFDICRRIKGSKRYGHIPIVMVSAIYRGWRVAADLKSSYGVEGFLEKPFKIGDVLLLVENALEGRGDPNLEDDILSREASQFLEEGMEAYRRGDLEAAIAKLREGIAIDPLSFQLHYHLGLLWGRKDNVYDAIHELETAVDLQPKQFGALKNLAILYQRAGFRHKAIEMWERALGNAPDDETRVGIKEHLMGLL